MSEAVNRPALRWHGGKWILAPWIMDHFPAHRIYTEAYGGGMSILLRKTRSYAEVYNDMDEDVVGLFRVLQDEEQSAALIDKLRLTPFSRGEFERAYDPQENAVNRAWALIVRSFMGFGSNSCNHQRQTGFRSSSNRSGTTPAHDWANYPDSLATIVERLRGVVIERRHAHEVLTAHDGPDTLHYVDPPYVHSTRQKGNLENYRYEMTDDDHRQLAAVLKTLRGGVIVSGYASPLYDQELFSSWHRAARAARADGALARTEVLWLNNSAWRGGNRLL